MSYFLFMPATRNEGMVRAHTSSAVAAVGRIAQPLKVGWSLLRAGGTWTQQSTPTQDAIDAVDTHTDGMRLYLAGGHWHLIEDTLYDEIIAAGFTGFLDVGESDGAYPSSTTYPSASLYPGAA